MWSIPRSARAFLLGTELLAVALTVGFLAAERPSATTLVRFGALLALTIGYAEVSKRSERLRRYLGAGRPNPRPNPLSVWSFAALLLLPVGWAAAFVAAQYAHATVQRRREQTSKPHRQIFVAAAAILAQVAAAQVLVPGALGHDLPGNLTVVAAATVFTAIDLGLMLTGIWLTARPPSLRAALPDGDALSYEFVSLTLGVMLAEMLLHAPWLVPVMLGPVAYIHRSAMVKALREAARTDSKTGLLNTAAWTEQAHAALARCARKERTAAVVIIDVDHFKAINDLRGHLVGDKVLTEVAAALRRELRGHDGIGRFGGDEFVVLLEEVDPASAAVVAERLQVALAAICVDDLSPGVSIGMANTGEHGATLESLLTAADGALYAAKAGGRGRVCVARWTAN
jgi:diguanylate cyclase (GGDEF)-like protein